VAASTAAIGGSTDHHQGNMASLKPGQAHRRGGT